MKKQFSQISKTVRTLLGWTLVLTLLAASCEKPVDPIEKPLIGEEGIFILNEGGFGDNNASISFYNFKTKQVTDNLFLTANQRGLGDVGNDLKMYGGKLYCVVNNSEVLEVINPNTMKSIKSLPLTGKQPRMLAFHQNKAFLTCYDGTVLRIDTTTLTIDGTLNAGNNPDGITLVNNQLYVANSGGYDYPVTSKSVSVIDPISFTEIKKIEVGIGPRFILGDDQGDLYVVCTGDYGDHGPAFYRIASGSEEVTNLNLPVINFTIHNQTAYLYHYDFYTGAMWIKVFNTHTESVINENFIADGTTIKAPYGVKVDPTNGDVYITDAIDFKTTGDLYCFSSTGNKKFKVGVGVCPSGSLVFKRK